MRRTRFVGAGLLWAGACSSAVSVRAPPRNDAAPLPAPVRPVADDYHGTRVIDPYRYMEDLHDPAVQAWMKGQDERTRLVLASLPGRARLLARIIELDESTPAEVGVTARLPGDRFVLARLAAKEDFAKLWWREGKDGVERLLLDPAQIRLAGATQAKGRNNFTSIAFSDDARYLVACIVPGGAEGAAELHVIEVATGHETGDVVTRASNQLAGPCWVPGRHAFVYSRLRALPIDAPATDVQQKSQSFLHELGTNVDDDRPVFGFDAVASIAVDPAHFGSIRTQPDSNHALGVVETGVSPNLEFWVEPVDALGRGGGAWKSVAGFEDDVEECVVHGDDLYLLTYKDAPHCKVVRTSAANPDLAHATTVLAAGEAIVRRLAVAQDALYVKVEEGDLSRLLRIPFAPDAPVEPVELPFVGAVEEMITDPRVPGLCFDLVSRTRSARICLFDPAKRSVIDTRLQPIGRFDADADAEESELLVTSHDGTRVPLSIVHAKELKRDGSHPTMLLGYGAYGSVERPFFERFELAWLERGGILAVAHVRGGGEFGEEWHLAGKGATKPNTWRDFIACAEHLVAQGYTSPALLTGEGGSAGGILIGRAITERPDLFGAAIIDVGLTDTLRAETTANGVPNVAEFGSTRTKEGFEALLAMSSYHHVRDGTPYPAVLLTTGINDPRVEPWQPAKMTARLQAATSSAKPILLRVDYGAGHGSGSGRHELDESLADRFSFMLWQAGDPEFQPPPARP